MLSTKNLVLSINDVPSYWVFQHYLGLKEELTGQRLRITSIWNPNERTPSMFLYVDKNKREYFYKDFSTGKQGNKVSIVSELFNIPYYEAENKIIEDYNGNSLNRFKYDLKVYPKFELDRVEYRNWEQRDFDFWHPFRINRSMLDEYNVKPIAYYILKKEEDSGCKTLKIEDPHSYGYLDKYGNPYKIYLPFNKGLKFYIVKDYLQGLDQLEYKNPYMIICSSLKDAMTLKGFGYNVEVVAPSSENSLIKPYFIEHFKNKYKNVITLFDNDDAGYKSIERYKQTYGINGTALPISKDISDAVKEFGFEHVHEHLRPLLKKTLNTI